VVKLMRTAAEPERTEPVIARSRQACNGQTICHRGLRCQKSRRSRSRIRSRLVAIHKQA
jgi:hypothetical protein